MSKVFVKNGTPAGGPSLCESCVEAQIISGFRESDVIVRCMNSYSEPLVVPFKVYTCTAYRDRNRPDWEQMEKFALVVNEGTSSKPAGFLRSDPRCVDDEEDEEFAASS